MLRRLLPVPIGLVLLARAPLLAQGPAAPPQAPSGAPALDLETYADHPRVRHFLEYFQGPARDRMTEFLARGARYGPLIQQRFAAESLAPDLSYLALIESGYSNAAVSRSRAVGMWQFLQGTGRSYGLRIDPWVDERRDPVKSTDAAARHLRDLEARFGSPYLAAAAYNAGAGRLAHGLDAGPDASPPAEDLVAEILAGDTVVGRGRPQAEPIAPPADAVIRLAGADGLATETRDYVPQLIAAALIAREPARYGFAAPPAAPLAYDSLVVADATSLDVVARLAGVTSNDVRALNPQYLRSTTPPGAPSVIRLPLGTGAAATAGYLALGASTRAATSSGPRPGPAPLPPLTMHRVRRGETLDGIAGSYQIPVAALRRANALPTGHRLRPGMRLRIPG